MIYEQTCFVSTGAMEDKKTTVSFGFSKRSEDKKFVKSTQNNEEAYKDVPDFITSLENKEVKSVKPKEERKDLVIPLIVTNNWKVKHDIKDKDRPPPKKVHQAVKDELDVQAMQEILDDTAKQNDDWEERDKDSNSYNIPLLMKNKVPEGYETDEKLDVSLRPEEPEDADYDEIPIEQYGMALLRGMGWKEGEGIGKNNKNVAPVEAVLRPKGMGLGADRKQIQTLNQSKQGGGGARKGDEEHLVLKKGAFCLIESGPHRDLYGVVEGTDEDNARLMVKLTVSGQVVTVSQYSSKLVSEREYNKYSKYINKGAADRYKEKEELKKDRKHKDRDSYKDRQQREEKSYRSDDSHGRKRDKHKDEHSEKSRKRKYEETKSTDRVPHTSSSTINGSHSQSIWLRPHLKVRIVDKHFKKGKYYGQKVVVVDVADRDHCVCQTDQGKCLQDLAQSMVETVIPKTESAYVAIVNGKHKGQIAHVMERDKSKCVATLQLLSDRDRVLKLDYDSICEYVGNIDDEFDY